MWKNDWTVGSWIQYVVVQQQMITSALIRSCRSLQVELDFYLVLLLQQTVYHICKGSGSSGLITVIISAFDKSKSCICETSNRNIYRLQMKLREGNVFTWVCLSKGDRRYATQMVRGIGHMAGHPLLPHYNIRPGIYPPLLSSLETC